MRPLGPIPSGLPRAPRSAPSPSRGRPTSCASCGRRTPSAPAPTPAHGHATTRTCAAAPPARHGG
eukprot:4519283-Prymnesium_polylepis.3